MNTVSAGAKSIVNDYLGMKLHHTPVNIENLATQALGSMVDASVHEGVDYGMSGGSKQQDYAATKQRARNASSPRGPERQADSTARGQQKPVPTQREVHSTAKVKGRLAEEYIGILPEATRGVYDGIIGAAKGIYHGITHLPDTLQASHRTQSDIDTVLHGGDKNGEAMSRIIASNKELKKAYDGYRYSKGKALTVGTIRQKSEAVTSALIDAGSVVFFGGAVRRGVVRSGSKLSVFGRGVRGVENVVEKTVRFTELASGSKAEVRALLKSGELNLPPEQVDKLLYTLGGGRMDKVTLKLMNSGDVRLAAERAGRTDGYQRMSFEINQQGGTNKVVQTAFDDANKLVPQRPGESKNNLYDVKKWNRQTY